MSIVNKITEFQEEIKEWRQDFHRHPELGYDLPRTAGRVEALLQSFGLDEVHASIGKSGVVGIIRGKGQNQTSGKTIGLRADMDALPINEISGAVHASTIEGKMHACGHDGHSAMLLGAAKRLCETRNFDGTVAVIFQPAEEGGAGAKAMIDDGMMERFAIEQVFGLHNLPGMPVGQFGINTGGFMAAADDFRIEIHGKGGHAALPHQSIDPIIIASQIISALQSVVARNTDPLESSVVSVTQIHAGDTHNIIPQKAWLGGTVRSLKESLRQKIKARIGEIAEQVAAAYGATVDYQYHDGYPVTVNHPQETALAAAAAAEVAGQDKVDRNHPALMGGEDFSYMLQARTGAFIFMGNGDSAGLHHPAYDFNDDAIPHGVSYWVSLVQRLLPLGKE